MIKNEIIYGTLFLLISILFFALTFQFPDITIALSPKVFPRFVSSCLFILSLALIFQGIKKQIQEKGELKKLEINKVFIIRFILLFVFAVIYMNILEFLGYVIATPLFIAISLIIFNEKRWYIIVLISILTTLVLYAIFRIVFRVPLPRFIFW
ncbi:MAG: tripartite tricarboxylate transporter TctB family protein [Spirochaetes bacterium]|nr:tripartite tricarboxylate transporter TctB family protein [Spirochaetota bacterium]